MKANQKTKLKSKKESEHLPETIEERVHRHISDINSKITDDDIRSVRTELDIRKDSNADEPGQQDTNNERQKEENTDNNEEKKTTSWDLLSEGYD